MDVILSLLNPVTGTTVQGVSASTASLTASQTPSVLANLPAGTLIRGFVLNRDAKGNPVLRTDSGDFLLESKFFLKIGSDVVVRLDASGQKFRASIISVDGHSPKDAENIPAHDKAGDVIIRSDQPQAKPAPAQTQATADRPPAPREAATLTGTLTRPTAQQPPVPGQPQPLPAGSNVVFKLLAIATPGTTPAAPRPETAQAAAPPAQAPQQQPQQQAPSLVGQLYNVYTKFAGQPAAPQFAPQTPQAPAAFPAQIVQTPDAPEPVLQTPFGTVRLSNAPNFPPGTRLTLELAQATPAGSTAPVRPATVPELAQAWPSLQKIVDLLTQIDQDAAIRFLRVALPTAAYGETPQWKNMYPDARNLGSGMALFMNALGAGNLRQWLGERQTQLLEKNGQSALLQKAEGEFSSIRALYHEATPGNWQALFVPIMAEGEVKQLRLYSKRGKRDRRKDKENDTRFIIEFELTQTGPMQLDGFVRKHEGKTQFDLVIRSHTSFTPDEQRDIQNIYSGIGDATGYSGLVQFQQVTDFTVKPLEEILSEQHRDMLA